jgi:hypothetical protein
MCKKKLIFLCSMYKGSNKGKGHADGLNAKASAAAGEDAKHEADLQA